MKVFVSYSRRDARFVERLDTALSGRGHDVWTDREDIGGVEDIRWRRAIVKAIRDSDVVVLVLSPDSTGSPNVERELTVAAANKKRVVPLMHRQCELPEELEYELAGIQYVDFTTSTFDDGIRRLAIHLGPAVTVPIEDKDHEIRPRRRDVRHVRPGVLIAGAGVLLVAIGALVFVLTRDPSPSEKQEAEDVVAAWATRRPMRSSPRQPGSTRHAHRTIC